MWQCWHLQRHLSESCDTTMCPSEPFQSKNRGPFQKRAFAAAAPAVITANACFVC